MLTPEYLSGCASYLLGMYDTLQEAMIADIARRIIKTGQMTGTAEWQASRLTQCGLLIDDITTQVANSSGKTEAEIRRLFEDSALIGITNDAQPLIDAGIQGEVKLSQAMANFLEATVKKVNGNVYNMTLTTATTAGSTYMDATNLAYLEVASGGYSYSEAIKKAVKTAAQDGNYVSYGNSRSQLDVAVRRAVMTGINQTCAKMTEMYSADMGVEYYEVSAHPGARESHAVWQGQVYKIDGAEYGYPNFEESTQYGDGAGLCGWNCRHSFFSILAGDIRPGILRFKACGV